MTVSAQQLSPTLHGIDGREIPLVEKKFTFTYDQQKTSLRVYTVAIDLFFSVMGQNPILDATYSNGKGLPAAGVRIVRTAHLPATLNSDQDGDVIIPIPLVIFAAKEEKNEQAVKWMIDHSSTLDDQMFQKFVKVVQSTIQSRVKACNAVEKETLEQNGVTILAIDEGIAAFPVVKQMVQEIYSLYLERARMPLDSIVLKIASISRTF